MRRRLRLVSSFCREDWIERHAAADYAHEGAGGTDRESVPCGIHTRGDCAGVRYVEVADGMLCLDRAGRFRAIMCTLVAASREVLPGRQDLLELLPGRQDLLELLPGSTIAAMSVLLGCLDSPPPGSPRWFNGFCATLLWNPLA